MRLSMMCLHPAPQTLMNVMTCVDAAVAPLRKTGQIKIHGPAAFDGDAQGRPACGAIVSTCSPSEVRPGRADRKDRPAGVRLRHGPRRACPRR